jgi:superfamily I DNA/RNA helicase
MNDSLSIAGLTSRTWSEEQQSIFTWVRDGKGNLVVQARAGTGKTTTVIESFQHAPEDKIIYLVFNKKNQIEAQGKVSDARVEVKTLHSLGYAYIRSRWRNAKPDSAVDWDRARQAGLELLHCRDLPSDVVGQVLKLVGFVKNLCPKVPSLAEVHDIAVERDIDVGDDWEGSYNTTSICRLALRVCELSLEQDKQGRISFDDMVWLPVVQGWAAPWYDLVYVDECQDMNICQLLMAQSACRRGGRIICVGDDRQAIYGFRGAASDGMGIMRERLNAATLGLTTTYRCAQGIVRIAQGIVSAYHAAPSNPEGTVDQCSAQALLKAAQVGDAVLSRTNAPLMPICLALLRAGVPARIEGRDVGKALAAIVKKLNAKSVPNLLEKLGHWEARKVKRLQASAKPGQDLTAQLSSIQDQAATIVALTDGASNVAEVVSRLESMFADTEQGQPRPMVVCSTVHKAKGLEWGRVFLLQETFKRRGKDGQEKQPSNEELNIYYVAVTRAKTHLTTVC